MRTDLTDTEHFWLHFLVRRTHKGKSWMLASPGLPNLSAIESLIELGLVEKRRRLMGYVNIVTQIRPTADGVFLGILYGRPDAD